jgi:hypothetical protein
LLLDDVVVLSLFMVDMVVLVLKRYSRYNSKVIILKC